jgi:hypothetical protein
MALFLQLGLAAIVAYALWFALRSRPAFVIKIKGGSPRVAHGTVTRGFAREVGDICAQHRVKSGLVKGVARGGRISLEFSRAIPPGCRQQLRNLWAISGWPAQPRAARR